MKVQLAFPIRETFHQFPRVREYRFLFTDEQIPSRISKSTNFPRSNRPRYTSRIDNNTPTSTTIIDHDLSFAKMTVDKADARPTEIFDC